ncbi:MAG: hypothetical protein PVS3B3_13880 [Ktedonobacteraceae bacterium]
MDDPYIVTRQRPHIVEGQQMVYWTRYPETALIGSPLHFRRRLHLFCVMTLEEARLYEYEKKGFPPLTPEEVRIVKAYLAQRQQEG